MHRGPALSREACGSTEIVKAAQKYEAIPVGAYRAHALQGSPHPAKCRSPLRSHTLPARTHRHQACYSQCAYLLFILAQARTYACSPPQQPFQADCTISSYALAWCKHFCDTPQFNVVLVQVHSSRLAPSQAADLAA